jgi:alkylated DNA repair dioxygenase AlkB
MTQPDLFGAGPAAPSGFRYAAELITAAEEAALIAAFAGLPFREFEFHGYSGKRRVVSYGWRYDFATERVREAEDIPPFLQDLQGRAAAFAGCRPSDLQQVLLTEYGIGAGIGWHKDKAVFGEVVGISLLSPCTFRLRKRKPGGWDRYSLTAEPRSAYLLAGPSRSEWEHSIPGVDRLRYSVTFRSMRDSNF